MERSSRSGELFPQFLLCKKDVVGVISLRGVGLFLLALVAEPRPYDIYIMAIRYLLRELLKSRLEKDLARIQDNISVFHNKRIDGSLSGRKPMPIMYKVPVADIISVWETQKAKYLHDLEEALATARDLKEKGVEDSCVNGKIDNARVNARMISLQLQYVDPDQDIYMQDHEMYGLFDTHRGGLGNIGGPDNAVTERRY